MSGSEQQQQQQQQESRFTFDDLVNACIYANSGEEMSQEQDSETFKLVSKAEQFVKALKRLQAIKNELIEEGKPKYPCLICLNEFKSLSAIDCCNHRFCFECIAMWTDSKTKCPACRKKIRKIFYDFQDDKYRKTKHVGDYEPYKWSSNGREKELDRRW